MCCLLCILQSISKRRFIILIAALSQAVFGDEKPLEICAGNDETSTSLQTQTQTQTQTANDSYQIISKIPHQQTAFTQGLVFYKDKLYESTGIWNESAVRKLSPENGILLAEHKLPPSFFGEGLTVYDEKLLQLSWKEGQAFFWNPSTLSLDSSLPYIGETWGITTYKQKLLVSNGSSKLKWFGRPFQQYTNLEITADGRPVEGLNELEVASSFVFANIYPTDCIARIDPTQGIVLGWLNLASLYPKAQRKHFSNVLNGIAYNPQRKTLFVTGKNWPFIYEIKLTSVSL